MILSSFRRLVSQLECFDHTSLQGWRQTGGKVGARSLQRKTKFYRVVYIFYLHSPCKKYIYKKTNFTLWKIILAPPMREEIEQRRPNWDDYLIPILSPHAWIVCVDSQPMWDDLQYWLLQDPTMFLSWMAEGAVYEGCIVPIRLHRRPMMKLALLQCCRMHQHSFFVFSVRGRKTLPRGQQQPPSSCLCWHGEKKDKLLCGLILFLFNFWYHSWFPPLTLILSNYVDLSKYFVIFFLL